MYTLDPGNHNLWLPCSGLYYKDKNRDTPCSDNFRCVIKASVLSKLFWLNTNETYQCAV